ncbi:MAG: DUF3891 family protein [Holophagales bacterium]|nr:DUF3891 family protein [Holophagales bacterium]
MIVNELDDALLVATQNDHAAFAAELLSLWRTEGMAEHPRRDALLFAARHHDDGWLGEDSAPRCDHQGRPYDYLSIPSPIRLELWQRGVHLHLRDGGDDGGDGRSGASSPPGEPSYPPDSSTYGALLIVRHALELHRRWPEQGRGGPAWVEALEQWRALEQDLADELGIRQEEIARDYRFVSTVDILSLAVCEGWDDPLELAQGDEQTPLRARQRSEGGVSILELDPFPLAGSTTFRLACRTIPRRVYRSDTDLAVELATARWQWLSVRVMPMGMPEA